MAKVRSQTVTMGFGSLNEIYVHLLLTVFQ